MVDGGGLENRCTRKGTGGSNPSLSATRRSPQPCASFGRQANELTPATGKDVPRSNAAPASGVAMMLDPWLEALEARHLADLTRSEVTRALRALSSCYVERRDKLATGAALDGAGKRAAFALFYGPIHFLTITAIVRELAADRRAIARLHDVGCGTGVAGAAWALAVAARPTISGIDRSAWAVAEANWTYRQLGVEGKARIGDAIRDFPKVTARDGLVLGYAVNELPDLARTQLLDKVAAAVETGTALLLVEPIAKRDRGWWPGWAARLAAAGAAEREWRFPAALPPALHQLAKGAGLDPRELTARTLSRI